MSDKNYIQHKEVLEAFEKGIGYNEEYSVILKNDFAYFAKRFDFHGEPYVVRISFPLRYVMQITQDFKIAFVFLSTLILLLFSIMTWIVLNYLTRPIQEIIWLSPRFNKGPLKSFQKLFCVAQPLVTSSVSWQIPSMPFLEKSSNRSITHRRASRKKKSKSWNL